jgi:hypothetical protein
MKYKHIEAAREARLWIGQIVVPGVTLLTTVLAIPEVRYAVAAKANQVKEAIDLKLKKKRV